MPEVSGGEDAEGARGTRIQHKNMNTAEEHDSEQNPPTHSTRPPTDRTWCRNRYSTSNQNGKKIGLTWCPELSSGRVAVFIRGFLHVFHAEGPI